MSAPCAAARRWRAGLRPCGARPSGASVPQFGHQPAAFVEQLLRTVAAQPFLEQLQMRGLLVQSLRSAPGARARNLRALCPSTSFGPVQPFGLRSTIIGQRRPLHRRTDWRASCWMRRISWTQCSKRRGHRLMHGVRVGPLDEIWLVAIALEQASNSSCGIRARIVGFCNLVAIECSTGSTARREPD